MRLLHLTGAHWSPGMGGPKPQLVTVTWASCTLMDTKPHVTVTVTCATCTALVHAEYQDVGPVPKQSK